MKKTFTYLLQTIFFASFMLMAEDALATDYVFTGTGNWDDPSLWNEYPGTDVGYGHTITIDGNCTITTSTSTSSEVTISPGATLINTNTFTNNSTLFNGGTFTNNGIFNGYCNFNGSFTNPADGTLAPGNEIGCMYFDNGVTNNGTISFKVEGDYECDYYDKINLGGSLVLNSGSTLNVTFDDEYTPQDGYQLTIVSALSVTGTFTTISPALPPGWEVTYNDPDDGQIILTYTTPVIDYVFTGDGNWSDPDNWTPDYPGDGEISPNSITIEGNCIFDVSYVNSQGPITVSPGGSLTLAAGVLLSVGPEFENNGDLMVEYGALLSISSGPFIHNGTSAIINGQLGLNECDAVVNANATLTINGIVYKGFGFDNQGTIAGMGGTFYGEWTNPAEGTIAPGGSSIGCLNFDGDLTNNGTVSIGVNGKETECSDYDKIYVNGTATLGGTLNVTFDGGYTPDNDDVITFLHANSISGTFMIDPPLSAGWEILYGEPSPEDVSLKYTAPPVTDHVFTTAGDWTDPANWNSYPSTTVPAGHTVTIAAACTVNSDVASEAPITINSGASFTLASDLTMNDALLTNDGDLTVNSNKLLTFEMYVGGGLTHNGTSATINGYLNLGGSSFSKTLTINSGKTLTVNGNLTNSFNTVNNNGTLVVNGSFTNVGNFNNNGTLKGTNGTIGGSFINPSGGTIAPGGSPGCLTFSDGWENQGTISIEVNGATPCSGHDRITVNNDVTLSGTLNVTFGGGYTPTYGDLITFLQANSISGTFASVSPALPAGWGVVYNNPDPGKVSLYYTNQYVFNSAGDWTDASKWTPGYPGDNITAGEIITIAAACTMNTTVTSASPVTINAGASLTVSGGNLTMTNALTNNGDITVNNARFLTINSGGSFTHSGTGATISGTLTNNADLTVSAGSTMTVSSSGQLTHSGNNFTLSGTLVNASTVLITAGKTMTIASSGAFNNDRFCNVQGILTNNGALTVSTGTFHELNIQNGGTFTHNGTSATISGTLAISSTGNLTVNAGKTLTMLGSGAVFMYNGTASISGILDFSSANMTIQANKTLTINSGGALNISGSSIPNEVYGTLINNGSVAVGSGQTLSIQSGGSYIPNGTTSISGSLNNAGTLNVNAGQTISVNSGGSFTVSTGTTTTISGTFTNNGTLYVGIASGTLTIANGGSVTGSGVLGNRGVVNINNGGSFTCTGTATGSSGNMTGTLTNNGSFTLNSGNTFTITSGTLTHNGTSATMNGTLNNTGGTINVNAGKTLTIGGSFTHGGGNMNMAGMLEINSGGSFTLNNSMNLSGPSVVNNGTFTVGNTSFSISTGITFTNNGSVVNNGNLNSNGTLKGTGSFTGNTINNNSGGNLTPGASPGCMTFSSLNNNNATVTIEVNGLTACTEYDKITASGTVSLNGSTLNVTVGYTPTINDLVTIIEASSLNNSTFSNVSLPGGWSVLYNTPSNGRVSLRYNGPPPSNDACAGAISVAVDGNYVTGTTIGANLSQAFACGFGGGGGGESFIDVWYTFTAPAGGAVTFRSGAANPFAAVFTGTCAGGLTNLTYGCMRGNGTVTGLTPGTTYYLQLATSSAGTAFDFYLEEPGAAPANDNCSNTIPVELGNQVSINSLYATTQVQPYCAPPSWNTPDLWYTFTATSNTIGYASTGGTVVLTIYGGDCTNLTQVRCAIPLGQTVPTNLVPGTTYYAQISSLGATQNGTFTITSPGDYTFTGAASSSFNNPSNWKSGVVPSASNNLTIPSGEICNLDMNFTPTGTITVQSGGMLNIQSGVTLNISNGTLANSGTIGGGGTIQGNFTNNTTVAPGSSPGCLAIAGNFTNAAAGTLAMEINGTTPCTQYDQLNVTGMVTFGGTLNVTWGFTPSAGNSFTLVSYGSRAPGTTFTTVNIPPVSGLSYTTSYTATEFTVTFSSILPIELVSFRANKVEDMVQLDWQTASELNNMGFEIQRSADAIQWELLHFENGNGTSTEAHHYSFLDEHPLAGINYYRLRQKDFDGQSEYSPTVSVEMERKGSANVFPNPASGTATLFLDMDYSGEATLKVYDLMGRQVKSQVLTLGGKALRTDIDLTDMPGSGIYLMVIEAGQQRWQQRVVVVE